MRLSLDYVKFCRAIEPLGRCTTKYVGKSLDIVTGKFPKLIDIRQVKRCRGVVGNYVSNGIKPFGLNMHSRRGDVFLLLVMWV